MFLHSRFLFTFYKQIEEHFYVTYCTSDRVRRFSFSTLYRRGDFIDVEHTVVNGRIIKNKSATGIIDERDNIDYSVRKDTGRFRSAKVKSAIRITRDVDNNTRDVDNNGVADEWLD